jgi:ABC-type phosphate/phosphonate transport system substrate-binding protein
VFVVCLALVLGGTGRAEDVGAPLKVVRIGMVGTLFRDVPDSLIDTMAKPFGMIMAAQTGMTGQLTKTGDARDLGRKLNDGQLHLGIVQGFEFAWIRAQFPQLRPLVIAVNQTPRLRAYLVVRSGSSIASFADLKEKTLDIPKGTRGYCRLFLENRCQQAGQCGVEELLGKVTSSPNAETALDEVVDGNIAATIVDNVSLDGYKHRKPGRFAGLQIAVESEVFPAGVVVYRAGTLDAKTLAKFRDGLLGTHKTILGKQLLTLWKLTGFENVPADYDQMLTDIAKAYPPPAEAEEEDEQ